VISKRNLVATAITVCAVASVQVAVAAPQERAAATTLEEVVVTARRRAENLQDVPVAVTAFSAETLSLRGIQDITELARTVPSVTLEPSRATNTTLTAFIRGVGQQDPLAGFEQGVALYVDDVYMARPQAALLDVYDVERIEVLRGPQGTLYGRNAVGGAIKYVTRRLADEPEISTRLSAGSENQIDAVLTGSMPLSDRVRAGATVASFNRDGYGKNVTTGKDQYNKDVLAARVSLEFDPTDDLLVRLAGDYTRDKSNPVAGHRPFPGAVSGFPVLPGKHDSAAGAADNASTAGIDGNNEIKARGLSGSVEWAFSDAWTVRSITAFRADDTDSVIDFDSLPVPDFDAPVVYENEQFSQEFQLLYTGDRLKVVTGVYYLDAEASNDFDVVLGQLVPGGLTAYTGGTVKTSALSVFADATYDLTDRVAVSVGGRYTEDERKAEVFRANYLGFGSPFLGNESAIFLGATSDFASERTFYDFSPRFNVSYLLGDATTVYGGFSQGFKAGSFDPRGANFATPEVERGFEPEQLDSWEIGIKSTWLDSRARTNVALFHSKYEDMQIPGSLPIDSDGDGVNDGFVGTVTNAAKATIKGIEIEGDLLLTEALSLQLAASFLDAGIDNWILNDVDVSDQRAIQNTPDSTVYAGLTYRTALRGGELILNGNWSYRDDVVQFEIPIPEIDQKAYSLFAASVVWVAPEGRWRLGLHGKNLGDKRYRTAGYNFPTLGLENNVNAFYGPPRTITAVLDYGF
jgi:iron complex outermembrane recepter protein